MIVTDYSRTVDDVPIPVVLLTGFLGAGKTTFLNDLLSHDDMENVAVIINEFGDVALDHLLVEQSSDDIIELASGCICCTIRGQLFETLERILERMSGRSNEAGDKGALRAIMIETTGLADPVPIVQALMAHPFLGPKFRLNAVLTMVDAVNGLASLNDHNVAVKQVALADHLLVTKTDLIDNAIPDALVDKIKSLNASAPVLDNRKEVLDLIVSGLDEQDGMQPSFLEGQSDRKVSHKNSHAAHGHAISSFCLVREETITLSALQAFLDLLASAHGRKLLRVKGLIKVADHPHQPVLVHGVQTVFHPPEKLGHWPDGDERSRLIFITDGLAEEFVQRLFDGFCNIPGIDTPDKVALFDNPLAIPGHTK